MEKITDSLKGLQQINPVETIETPSKMYEELRKKENGVLLHNEIVHAEIGLGNVINGKKNLEGFLKALQTINDTAHTARG
jgi:hypothetical protein